MSFWSCLVNAVRGGRLKDEIDEELASHIAEALAEGRDPVEVRRAFGSALRHREASLDIRRLHWIVDLGADLRYATRSFRKNPAFATTAVVSLALGIGANVGLFSVFDRLVLRSLPVTEPSRLVRLSDDGHDGFTYPTFDLLRHRSTAFSDVIGMELFLGPRALDPDPAAPCVVLQAVSGNYFDALGVHAAVGRIFHAADAFASDGAVAVLSETYWRRHDGGVSSALGTHFSYANRTFTVVGVAQAGFHGVNLDAPEDMWVPLEQSLAPNDMLWTRGRVWSVVARLPPGMTLGHAQAQASAVLGHPITAERGANGFSLLRGQFARPLVIVQTAMGLILLIMTTNLASLMWVRAASRSHEFAIRRALGASRARLLRQVGAEGLLAAALGGALALEVGKMVSQCLLGFVSAGHTLGIEQLAFHMDRRVLAACAVLSLASCLLFAWWPAWRATTPAQGSRLGVRAESSHARSRVGRVLVTAELAMCAALAVGATLYTKTVWNLWHSDMGFDVTSVLMAEVQIPAAYRKQSTDIFDELRRRVTALPTVEAAGITYIGQLSGHDIEGDVFVAGKHSGPTRASAVEQRVSPGVLAAMGTRLVAGRDFDDRDVSGTTPVAIVDEAFVRRFLGSGPAVGRRFSNYADRAADLAIVGVVQDSKVRNLREVSQPMYYRPLRQQTVSSPLPLTLVIRSSDLRRTTSDVANLSRQMGGRIVVQRAVPFATIVADTLVTERLVASFSTAFGLLALIIVAIGVYGTLAHSVTQRTAEIGVRMALGATHPQVRWMIVRQALGMLFVGAGVGITSGILAARTVSSMLFGLTPEDPPMIAIVLVVLTAVATAASYLPARRASAIDPVVALRAE